jgi:glutamate formiminotransferase/formiminotetrahydrofolate cyclodeaminase
MKLVECVPNFSEGRDREKIKAITQEIEGTPGVRLLDVDPGESTNRTVVTFVGPPEGVKEAAFRAIRKAADLIDMRQHRGAHSRIGATDVCPFVPVSGVTMEDCVQLARELGERVARELGIPVYLYEEAAVRTERRNLASIRAGEYEGLAEKLKDPEWAPDFGQPIFNPKSGATVIGAREFLIAYNINLNTRDRRLAHEIALNLRESGRAKRDAEGNIIRDGDGRPVQLPGRFSHVKAVGWYIEDYGLAQVSINFTNYKLSPVHLVFDEAVKEAEKRGLRVTGSELVGLVPKKPAHGGTPLPEKQGKAPACPKRSSSARPSGPSGSATSLRSTRTGRLSRTNSRRPGLPCSNSACANLPTRSPSTLPLPAAEAPPPFAPPSLPPCPPWWPTSRSARRGTRRSRRK